MPSKLRPRVSEHAKVPAAAAAERQASAARWRSRTREDILEPDLPIIDSHHHLWERAGNRYLLDEHLADLRSGHNVRATVYVECGSFDTCIETFGPSRCMFESNFPPDRESVDYPVLWNAFKRIAAKYSATERQSLFCGAAAQAYRLDLDLKGSVRTRGTDST